MGVLRRMDTLKASRTAPLSGRRALGLAAAALVASGCSTGYEALGTRTAHVMVNGVEISDQLRVTCEQVQWVWFIDSIQESPGFTAQVRTGADVDARLVRIENLGGFTGSAWNATVRAPSTPPAVEADAKVVRGTFEISGAAMGFYQDDPAEISTATFEIRTDC